MIVDILISMLNQLHFGKMKCKNWREIVEIDNKCHHKKMTDLFILKKDTEENDKIQNK